LFTPGLQIYSSGFQGKSEPAGLNPGQSAMRQQLLKPEASREHALPPGNTLLLKPLVLQNLTAQPHLVTGKEHFTTLSLNFLPAAILSAPMFLMAIKGPIPNSNGTLAPSTRFNQPNHSDFIRKK